MDWTLETPPAARCVTKPKLLSHKHSPPPCQRPSRRPESRLRPAQRRRRRDGDAPRCGWGFPNLSSCPPSSARFGAQARAFPVSAALCHRQEWAAGSSSNPEHNKTSRAPTPAHPSARPDHIAQQRSALARNTACVALNLDTALSCDACPPPGSPCS